jgi:hypothetical protein
VSFAPILLWGPSALTDVLRYHFNRGLQVESTLGLALAVVRALSGHAAPATLSFGSFNLAGSDAHLLGAISMPLLLGAMAVWSWYLFRAREQIAGHRSDGLAVALLGACVVVWLCGKIFSPQYLTWVMAIALALSPRLGRKVTVLLLVAMALTQLYHRGYYDELVLSHPIGLLTAVARQGVLVALAVALMSWAARLSVVDASGLRGQSGRS